MLQWDTLLSATRYGHPADLDPNRSDFHRDYDRIVFSTAFRRLGRKTQVHPFSVNDHVHSRLTHSIEVSRAQHACFDVDAVAALRREGITCFADGNFDELIARANDEDFEYEDSLFVPMSTLLKGPEMPLPEGEHFTDAEGVRRIKTRIAWWLDPPINGQKYYFDSWVLI